VKVPGIGLVPFTSAQPPEIAQAELLLKVITSGAAKALSFSRFRRARRSVSAFVDKFSFILPLLDFSITDLYPQTRNPCQRQFTKNLKPPAGPFEDKHNYNHYMQISDHIINIII
jgi:hypothetical protein